MSLSNVEVSLQNILTSSHMYLFACLVDRFSCVARYLASSYLGAIQIVTSFVNLWYSIQSGWVTLRRDQPTVVFLLCNCFYSIFLVRSLFNLLQQLGVSSVHMHVLVMISSVHYFCCISFVGLYDNQVFVFLFCKAFCLTLIIFIISRLSFRHIGSI